MGHDTTDQQMIDYLGEWHRYGGGDPQDILARFEMTSESFFRHVLTLLEHGGDAAMPPGRLIKMRQVCRARLWVEG